MRATSAPLAASNFKARKAFVAGRVVSRNGFGGMSGPRRFIITKDSVFLEEQEEAVIPGHFSGFWQQMCIRSKPMADQTQREKFEHAARELECDEDERRWDATATG